MLYYKKPAFWIIVAAIVTCIVVAVCFLANPVSHQEPATNAQIVETITTQLRTYYKLSDGTWQTDGRIYRYCHIIRGRMPNAAVDSTFVYLSNLETITFEQAWRAAGLSSNSEDYFSPEEAVLVDWTNG